MNDEKKTSQHDTPTTDSAKVETPTLKDDNNESNSETAPSQENSDAVNEHDQATDQVPDPVPVESISEVGSPVKDGESNAEDRDASPVGEVSEEGMKSKSEVEETPAQSITLPFWLKTFMPFLSVLNFVLILALAGGIYWGVQQLRTIQGEYDQVVKQLQLTNSQQSQQQNSALARVNELDNALKQQQSQWRARADSIEKVQDVQGRRLLSMSTITREDWLLAEAEYLLKLANQRVLIEKSPDGAEALLVEADDILRGLDDPELYPLRQAIAKDLAALRLTQKIDVEGIYLEIAGLIAQIDRLPARPGVKYLETRAQEDVKDNLSESKGLGRIKASFANFTDNLKAYIRIKDHSEKPAQVLVPELDQYTRQNLRFMLEQAQLALLREEQTVYQMSMKNAVDWTQSNFPISHEQEAMKRRLEALQSRAVSTALPNISGSLKLLHLYIEQLHQLKGAAKPKVGSANVDEGL